ncbi:response regulator [Romboutsia sp. 1001216sp1]|uniref:response regulator n=1 Tax=Romboutsia sp. 1001216sp1 TaxID=2986997 RepID=UPI00232B6C08|nr:response regulator transcription factor [Romboutsia sp. 1001216sp1]MDB8805230.1 response regulator transcription factor [Romboutsia sp. 1001216sp1]MDB8807096.1 response regulator transcription factor [Romboutsia sp. 1001216sp1]MDB8810875.1 response regulator transcription factor [Romboutsia sp. 1001216sp1]MDB8816595.1 response regulator transcription factor [Romboutsia sp. 1001216sp1]MDB8819120.1 response regulator transcription factor [Romboutsia sp. 1001216sp1]
MIKLIIVDDDVLIRESLKIIIGIDSEIEVVKALENGKECIDFLSENEVDVVLLDMRMPVMDGAEVLEEISKRNIKVKVLILTTFDEEKLISSAIKHKTSGYLLKSSKPEKIISGIKSVYLGNGVFESDIVSKLVVGSSNKNDKSDDEGLNIYGLTDREKDIVRLISKGLSNKEIANKLFLSEGTIKNHITSILSKMDLKHRTQIAIEYLNSKIH